MSSIQASKPILKIDWASTDAANHACKHWHYSKSVPVPPLVKIGVWENEKFIGVVIFSRGASAYLFKAYGLEQDRGCELTRIALNNHITPVSRIIRIAIKFLKQNSPLLRLIVSFADPAEGHHGGVYQATNWIYSGQTDPSTVYYHQGKKLHRRQVSEKGWNIQQGEVRKTIKPSQCRTVQVPGKHRYLFPLDDEMRDKIMLLSKPYPKRLKQAMDVPTSQRRCITDQAAP